MNHLMAVKKSYLQRQPEIVENVLRALVEGLAFTWSPKGKSAVLKSVMRRLRITDMALAEEGYQELLTRGGLEKRPHPSLEGMRNVQRLMQVSNPRVGEVKLEEVVDRSVMRKLEDSGFIERMYNFIRKVIVFWAVKALAVADAAIQPRLVCAIFSAPISWPPPRPERNRRSIRPQHFL